MLIPIRHLQVGEAKATQPHRTTAIFNMMEPGERRPKLFANRDSKRTLAPDLTRIERRLAQLKHAAANCTRLVVILLGVLALHWQLAMPVSRPLVALSIALGCLALALGYAPGLERRSSITAKSAKVGRSTACPNPSRVERSINSAENLKVGTSTTSPNPSRSLRSSRLECSISILAGWPALVLDSLTITFLLYGTGGASSPLLALTLLPMLLGGLAGNSNGALAGGGAGVAILLIVHIARRHAMTGIVAELALLHIACGLAVSWLWRRADELLASLRDDLRPDPEAVRDLESTQQSIGWQQLNQQIAACATLEQLARLATSYAATITGTTVHVDLIGGGRAEDSGRAGPQVTCIPIPCDEQAGVITIHAAPGELSLAQRAALDHLASMAGLGSAALRCAAWRERQQAALAALWEISGLLRVAASGYDHVRDGLTRLAGALELGWLALLAPNEYQALAPAMIVRGRTDRGMPSISGVQLRVAAEALRGERPLVRVEGSDSLACLPICLAGHAPLVLAAYGNAGDAATQALLMLFGNLIAERLASDSLALEPQINRCQSLAA
jgi:hypothetical protein